jgi:hypothetical protein
MILTGATAQAVSLRELTAEVKLVIPKPVYVRFTSKNAAQQQAFISYFGFSFSLPLYQLCNIRHAVHSSTIDVI